MDQIRVITDGLSGTKTLLNTIQNQNGKPVAVNKQILDPMTSLIKLAVLNFRKKGTKIGISNNKIQFQSPDVFQGTIRWRNGDNRFDLHNLCNPIERSVEWYDCKNNPNIATIFTLAISGLKKFKESYKDIENTNLVCDAISHYISILENKLEKNIKPDKINLQTLNESNINKSLKNMWESDEIAIISSMLILAKKKKYQHDVSPTVRAIECLLECKDSTTHDIILKYTTTL